MYWYLIPLVITVLSFLLGPVRCIWLFDKPTENFLTMFVDGVVLLLATLIASVASLAAWLVYFAVT